jgi:hypothetical protein
MLRIINARPSGAVIPCIVALLLCASAGLRAQVFEWTTMGGGEAWKHGHSIAVDAAGNSFAVGKFSAQPTHDPQTAGLISFGGLPSLTVAGVTDAFVVAHSPSGTLVDLLQFKSVNPGDAVTATGVAFYEDDIYVTGDISGTVDFGNPLLSLAPALPRSSYIAKVDIVQGNPDQLVVAWVAYISPRIENEGTVRTSAIAVYDDYIYVTGSIEGEAVAYSATSASPAFPPLAPVTASLYIARYTMVGVAQEVTVIEPTSSTSTSHGAAITAGTVHDAFGTPRTRVAATGTFRGDVELLGQPLDGEDNFDNMLVAIIDDGGSITELRGASKNPGSPTGHITGRGIAMNSDGDVYVAGEVGGTVKFDQLLTTLSSVGPRDYYIAKFGTLTGNYQFSMRGGATLTSEAFANAIAINDVLPREIYVAGGVSGTVQIGDENVTSMGNTDVFVAKYTEPTNGIVNNVWARRAGNRRFGLNRFHQDQGMAIAVTPSGYPYVIGEFGGSGDPAGDAEFFAHINLTADQYRNVFVSRISSAATRLRGRVSFSNLFGSIPHERHRVELRLPFAAGTERDEVMTGPDGWYTAYAPLGSTYRVDADPLPHGSQSFPFVPNTFYQQSAGDTSLHFLFDTTAFDTAADLRVEVTPIGTEYAVPGAQRCYRVFYENHGVATMPPGTTILVDASDLLSNPTTVATTGAHYDNTLQPYTWKIDGPIAQFDNGEFIVCFDFPQTVDPDPPIRTGTELLSTVEISNASEDPGLEGDNLSVINDDVFFPLDPNLKRVLPSETISVADVRNGRPIEYMIDFYNLGPNHAHTVTISDTLSHLYFDMQAADPLTLIASAPGSTTPVIDGTSIPNVSLATFVLNQIDLLAMHQDVSASRGFVRYTAKLRRDLPVGTVVRNVAGVQFDNLRWFVTDTTLTCVAPGFDVSGICLGQTSQFTSTPSTGSGYLPSDATGIVWDFGDGAAATAPNPTHQYTQPGTYEVVMRFASDSTICDLVRDRDQYVIRRTITIYPIPAKPEIRRRGDTLFADSAAHYQWLLNNAIIPGATKQWYVVAQSGEYSVRISNAGGCEAVSDVFASVDGDDTRLGAVAVTPNPGTGRFRLTLSRPSPESITVSVHDGGGRMVRSQSIERGATSIVLDLAGAPSGAYSASFELDGQVVTRHFVLQR